jgi:hypothetical protein
MSIVRLVCLDFNERRGRCREWVEDNSPVFDLNFFNELFQFDSETFSIIVINCFVTFAIGYTTGVVLKIWRKAQ